MKKTIVLSFLLFCMVGLYGQTDTIYRNLTVVQADSLIQAHVGDPVFVILDMVRQAGPYNAAHIAGAINIDYYATDFSTQIAALDHNLIYLVHCQSGGRSAATFSLMQMQHFREVYNMLGGMNAWVAGGYPVVTATYAMESEQKAVQISPNPMQESAIIQLPVSCAYTSHLVIYNETGMTVSERNIEGSLISVPRSEVTKGLCFFRISTEDGQILQGRFLVE